jgi:hypothetical protein
MHWLTLRTLVYSFPVFYIPVVCEQRIVFPPIHPARLLSSQPNTNSDLDIGLGARRRLERTALASEMADLGYRPRSAREGGGVCGPELVGDRCGSVSPSS